MSRTLRTLAGLLVLLLPVTEPRAQDFLGGGAPESAPHVEWSLRVEPPELPPGGRGTLVVRYKTAPRWHLYSPDHTSEQNLGVATKVGVNDGPIRFDGPLTHPEAVVKQGPETLDEAHRYLEGEGELRQPFVLSEGATEGPLSFDALLSYMTCDDGGICDIPQRDVPHPVTLTVVAAAPSATETTNAPAAPSKGSLKGGGFLPPALQGLTGGPGLLDTERGPERIRWQVRVEPPEARRGGEISVVAAYEISDGWHIYAPDSTSELGPPTQLEVVPPPGIALRGALVFPQPYEKKDEVLDETFRILKGRGELRQPLVVSPDASPGAITLTLQLKYQYCSDSQCMDGKTTESATVTILEGPPVETPPEGEPAAGGGPAEGEGNDGQEKEGQQEPRAKDGLLFFILSMIGGGLFTLVMPCTYPMIPITISFFTKQAEARGGNVLPLSLAYGAGIVLVFNVIGWLFASSIGHFAANPILNLVFALLFLLFGLSLLGLFTLRLPTAFNQLASRAQGSSGYLGVFLLGTTLVITSFTCTAPVLGPLLVFAAEGGDLGRVTLGMTVFGLTIATPFVVLSLFPARIARMPKAGEWMHTLKVSLGFIELAAALKFFSNAELVWGLEILPRELFLVVWALIFGVLGLYLLQVFHLRDEQPKGIGTWRLVFAMLALFAALYFWGGSRGTRLDWVTETLAPPYHTQWVIGAPPPGPDDPPRDDAGLRVTWTIVKDDLEAGLAAARAEGKRAFINFTGVT